MRGRFTRNGWCSKACVFHCLQQENILGPEEAWRAAPTWRSPSASKKSFWVCSRNYWLPAFPSTYLDFNDTLTAVDLMENLDLRSWDSKDVNKCIGATVPDSQPLYTSSPSSLTARPSHKGGDGESKGSSEDLATRDPLRGRWPEIMPSEIEKLYLSQASLQTSTA